MGIGTANAVTAETYSVFNPHPDTERTANGTWFLHDLNRPQPPRVEPKAKADLARIGQPPHDAIILFNGSNLDAWIMPEVWKLSEGSIRLQPENLSLKTREPFGSCHLHLEWRTPPENFKKSGQDKGNSCVFLMSNYEIQILDTYENKTYPDGMAAALYGVKPPDANALRPSGEWQSYDIWFKRPFFDERGKMTSPACATVMVNGVVVQRNVSFEGPSSHKNRQPYRPHPDALPLRLQNHNEVVEFRNIWIQPLPDEAVLSPAGPVGIDK